MGIGIGVRQAQEGQAWRGQNLLGKALMEVRAELRIEMKQGAQRKARRGAERKACGGPRRQRAPQTAQGRETAARPPLGPRSGGAERAVSERLGNSPWTWEFHPLKLRLCMSRTL